MPAGRKLSPFVAAGTREISGTPLVEPPAAPEWMRPAARQEFERVAGYLVSIRAVTAGEVGLIEQYACCWGRWIEAEMLLAKGDLHYREVTNRQGEPSSAVALPAMAQASKSLDQLRRLGQSLGLSPVERARLPQAGSGSEDEFDRLVRESGAAW
jgi:P27 family predicted phage terminase small subunit